MKSNISRQGVVSFAVGALFAVGLALSGMTQPAVIIAFLNPADWDPSLLFVMMGAVGVHMISYPLVRRRSSPLLDTKWHVPTRNDFTPRLILGAALFGVGWGLGGFCPGPGIVSLVTGETRAIVFVATMLFGMLLFRKIDPYLKIRG